MAVRHFGGCGDCGDFGDRAGRRADPWLEYHVTISLALGVI